LAVVVCLGLTTACGPIYFAHPPPVAGPQLVTPLDVGQVGVGITGVKATPQVQYSSLGLTNPLGAYAGVGLTPDLDLRISGGSQQEGPLGGVSLAWTFQDSGWALFRATGGLGATYSQSGYTEQHEVFDDGALVVYDDGQSVTVKEPKTYSYATLAPHVGVAAVLFPDKMVMVPAQLRLSRSSIVPISGGDPEGTPPWWWVEASLGAAMVLDRSEVSVGLDFRPRAAGPGGLHAPARRERVRGRPQPHPQRLEPPGLRGADPLRAGGSQLGHLVAAGGGSRVLADGAPAAPARVVALERGAAGRRRGRDARVDRLV
jgi:hypothetical protein